MGKFKIKTSKDVTIEYSELCDCDEIYIVDVNGSKFQVSYRFWSEMDEPQIWILHDNGEADLICTTKKLSKTKKADTIKSAFIAYMIGNGMLEIVD